MRRAGFQLLIVIFCTTILWACTTPQENGATATIIIPTVPLNSADQDPNVTLIAPPTVDIAVATATRADLLTPETPTVLASAPSIELLSPVERIEVAAGSAIDVSGKVGGVDVGQTILVALVRPDDSRAASTRLVAKDGIWRALLVTPREEEGELLLVAALEARDGQWLGQAQVSIGLNGTLATTEPEPTEEATNSPIAQSDNLAITYVSAPVVAGKGIHLRGTAQSPLEQFELSLGIYLNDCTTTRGTISFPLSGSGSWFAYLTVPEDVTGKICVRAFIGNASPTNPQTVQVELDALARDSAESTGLIIANPQPNARLTAPIEVDGIAFGQGSVNVTARGTDGTLFWSDVVVPDRAGYWRLLVPLADGAYSAEIVATAGEHTVIHPITISPRPTPVPAPTLAPEPTESADDG